MRVPRGPLKETKNFEDRRWQQRAYQDYLMELLSKGDIPKAKHLLRDRQNPDTNLLSNPDAYFNTMQELQPSTEEGQSFLRLLLQGRGFDKKQPLFLKR